MWVVENSILAFKENTQIKIPHAVEIFDNVFYGVLLIGDKKYPSIKETFPDIDFQRYVASILLVIEPSSKHLDDGLIIRFVAKLDDQCFDIPFETVSSSVDHVVVNKKWLALRKDLTDLLSQKLDTHSIDSPYITLKHYLSLKDDPEIKKIIDDKTGNFTHSSKFSPKKKLKEINGLNATLYPYQLKGVSWLRTLSGHNVGAILGDEMGLGKTLQIIALVLAEKKDKSNLSTLVVVPASLIENWKREISKFAPSLTVYIHHGPTRTPIQKTFLEHDVTITTYDLVSNDILLLKNIYWNLLVLDEGHAIRNPEALRTQAVKELQKRMGILVTGTPLVNKFLDLWSITDFTNTEYLGSRANFENQYPYSVDSAKELEEKVSPILLRREVAAVAKDLPEKIIIPQWITFSENEMALYKKLLNSTLEGKPSFARLMKLRRFCCLPSLVIENYGGQLGEFSKKTRLIEIVQEVVDNSEKIIIFTEFVDIVDMLFDEIPLMFGIYTNKIYGRTPNHERQKIIDDFSGIAGSACLILNYKAAGVGLNIQAANHIILYNPVWNPADEDQAVARAYRRGQKKPVRVHRFSFVNSIEELMQERLEMKRDVIENAIEGVEGNPDDIHELWKQLSSQA